MTPFLEDLQEILRVRTIEEGEGRSTQAVVCGAFALVAAEIEHLENRIAELEKRSHEHGGMTTT